MIGQLNPFVILSTEFTNLPLTLARATRYINFFAFVDIEQNH